MSKIKIPKIQFEGKKEEVLDLNKLPFFSTFKIISFTGDGLSYKLTNNFDINEILGHRIVIKSIKFFLYTNSVDNNGSMEFFLGHLDQFNLDYGNNSILLNGQIINEDFDNSADIEFKINDTLVLFKNNVHNNYSLSKNYDNIYFYFPDKIQSISLKMNSLYFRNLPGPEIQMYKIRVIMEIYCF